MKPCNPKPVKLFVGALYAHEDKLTSALERLEEKFSKIDLESTDFPFRVTDYYSEEMGSHITRRFCSFQDLVDPQYLSKAKVFSNSVESMFSVDDRRLVNLDVGYVDYDKVVLASAKYGIHKVYIGHGIYADMTLHYEKGKFSPYPWAFMDFKLDDYYEFFLKMRGIYKKQVKGFLTDL